MSRGEGRALVRCRLLTNAYVRTLLEEWPATHLCMSGTGEDGSGGLNGGVGGVGPCPRLGG